MFKPKPGSVDRRHRRPNRRNNAAEAVPVCEKLEDRVLLSLLGVGELIEPPDVYYDSDGTLQYDAVDQSLNADAAPTSIALVEGTRPIRILSPRDFLMQIVVDNDGNLVGGIEGDDLVVIGAFDADGDRVVDYDGVLLTGEVLAFGYLDASTATDQYDFRFTPTGGLLMPYFEGYDIGLDMTSLSSTFAGSFAESFSGGSQGVLGVIPKLAAPPSSLAGRVFLDADNNGVDDGDAGIAGVEVTLSGTDVDGNVVSLIATTDADGAYAFEEVAAGTYNLTEAQPIDLLDGDDSAGAVGIVGNDVVTDIILAGGEDLAGYNFGEILPASLSGLVYEDFNNDGEVNFGEKALEGVTVSITGVDDRGQDVAVDEQTDADGVFFFADLRPGVYTVSETQPSGHEDGIDTIGTLGGTVGDDVFSDVAVNVAQDGMNYNFGERPQAGSEVVGGQTATIGFWQNKHGQNLIKSLNGGQEATQLSAWLAATFPNMFGASAGDNCLVGMSNADVAQYYRDAFKAKRKGSKLTANKLECQVIATAFAAYVTNSSLAGNVATQFGFLVSDYGVGIASVNVGDSGEAFGVADNTVMTVMDCLLATNAQTVDGVLYNMDNLLRSLANDVYSMINESGDI